MNILVLDLELNKPSGNIIQIGAVVGNLETNEVLDYVCDYIKIDEQLDPFIISLTGITQDKVDSGIYLQQSYLNLKEIHKKHQCFLNLATWGGGDSDHLYKQLGCPSDWSFGRRHLDVKTYYQLKQMTENKKPQGGLAKSMTKLGLKFLGSKHNALDDSYNTFRILLKLTKNEDTKPFKHLHLS